MAGLGAASTSKDASIRLGPVYVILEDRDVTPFFEVAKRLEVSHM
jgi:hypothetical protein